MYFAFSSPAASARSAGRRMSGCLRFPVCKAWLDLVVYEAAFRIRCHQVDMDLPRDSVIFIDLSISKLDLQYFCPAIVTDRLDACRFYGLALQTHTASR